jgi:NhaP-type Na+/H+ or K+/H+ antiporter
MFGLVLQHIAVVCSVSGTVNCVELVTQGTGYTGLCHCNERNGSGWLIGYLVWCCLVGLLSGSLFGWLVNWLAGWLLIWSFD